MAKTREEKKAQKREEREARTPGEKAERGGAALTSMFGLGAPIVGMIPSLLAGPQRRQLEQYQRGQGAGAAVARQTGSEAARRVLGASTAQPSSGRGGALREGLRAADVLTQRGAEQAAITGAREGLAATDMLRRNELMRRRSAAMLGVGTGMGLAGIGATLAAAQDQGPVKEQPGFDVDYTGYPSTSPGETFDPRAGGVEPALGAGGVITQPPGAPAAAAPVETPAPGPGVRGQFGIAPGTVLEPDTISPATDLAISAFLSSPAQQLAQVTAERQQTADTLKRVVETGAGKQSADSEQPPPATDPGGINTQEYFYNQALNYNPVLEYGMRPQDVAHTLIRLNYPVDWARLGLVPPVDETPVYPAPVMNLTPRPRLSPHGELEQKATSGARSAGETIRSKVSGERKSQ